MARQRFSASQVAEYYLVDLMARFMVTSNLELNPLATLFLQSQSPNVADTDKVKMLKKLGDTSLYISGFFGDSLNRKVVDLEYYRQMGSIAYRTLSGVIREDTF